MVVKLTKLVKLTIGGHVTFENQINQINQEKIYLILIILGNSTAIF